MKPMNLLFIMSDQHSKNKFGAYGNDFIQTPNLDQLCNVGVKFENAYCTNPVCVPSRASIACGDYGFKHSYWDNSHPYNGTPDSWGTRLTEQGYQVTTIGKLHYKNDSTHTGFPDQRIPLHLKNGIGDLTVCIRDRDAKRPNQRDMLLKAGAGESDYLTYDAKIADTAARFLKEKAENPTDKPFCLHVSFVTPHFPLTVPERLLKLYEPYDRLPFPIQLKPEDRPNHPILKRFRELVCTSEAVVTDEVVMKALASYYALVSYMDEQVGVVLNALKDSGLAESTRIIYTTDHGDTMGDHGIFFKNTMYEGSAGVPLVVAGPDIPKGKSVKSCVSLVDIFPSVLECLGTKPKPEDTRLPGHSLWEYAKGKETNRAIFCESHAFAYKHAVYMLRYGNYKLVYYVDGKPQLFNIEEDPMELNDLSDDVAYLPVIDDLTKRLVELCNPEEIDAQALDEQKMLLGLYGGADAILMNKNKFFYPYSTIPDGI